METIFRMGPPIVVEHGQVIARRRKWKLKED